MQLKRTLIATVLGLVLLAGAGCEVFDREPADLEALRAASDVVTMEVEPIDADWQPATAADGLLALPSVADVVARVKPSVVSIGIEFAMVGFFNQTIVREGGGSGWIIDDSGIIVTNAHVVTDPGMTSMTVTLDDGRVVPVDLSTIRADQQTDLAVLKITATGLTALTVGNSDDLRVGEWVIAIGNSLGYGVRATLGIVSQTDVPINQELGQPLRLIETDAAINPGNSGGPLVNMAGEVIGINEAKAERVDIEGVGWAIASSDALPVIRSLINLGYVVRPWLGVGTMTATPTLAYRYGLSADEGVVITNVLPGSPAEEAGIEVGDVVVVFNGEPVATDFEMVSGIHGAQIGDTVEIVYWRDDRQRVTEATLIERPNNQ